MGVLILKSIMLSSAKIKNNKLIKKTMKMWILLTGEATLIFHAMNNCIER